MKIHRRIKGLLTVLLVLLMFGSAAAQAADWEIKDSFSEGQRNVLTILDHATVENGADGDVVAVFGSARVKGIVRGDVIAIGGDAEIKGQVLGDVVAVGGTVILRGQSVVNGDVVGSSIEKSPDAALLGDIVQIPVPHFTVPSGFQGRQIMEILITIAQYHALLKLGVLLVTLALIMVLTAIYPKGVDNVRRSVEEDTIKACAVGFIASLLFVPVALTIIGIPVIIFLVVAAYLLGYAGVTLYLGRKFTQAVKWETDSFYYNILTGIILIGLVKFVPFIGGLVGLVLFWISLGAMLDSRFGTGRPWFNKAA